MVAAKRPALPSQRSETGRCPLSLTSEKSGLPVLPLALGSLRAGSTRIRMRGSRGAPSATASGGRTPSVLFPCLPLSRCSARPRGAGAGLLPLRQELDSFAERTARTMANSATCWTRKRPCSRLLRFRTGLASNRFMTCSAAALSSLCVSMSGIHCLTTRKGLRKGLPPSQLLKATRSRLPEKSRLLAPTAGAVHVPLISLEDAAEHFTCCRPALDPVFAKADEKTVGGIIRAGALMTETIYSVVEF